MKTRPWVYAEWIFPSFEVLGRLLVDGDLHISCGYGDDQIPGYLVDHEGAKLQVWAGPDGCAIVRLEAPAAGLTRFKDYWLSPCPSSEDFGVIYK